VRIALLLWLVASAPARGQIYEWIDADGKRHFSDRKPVGFEFRILDESEDRLTTYRPAPVPPPAADRDARSSPHGSRARREPAGSRRDRREAICRDYLDRLEAVQDQLRAGYDEPRGNRLRATRRELRRAYRRTCQ
jgi:hypothetical protein